MKLTPLTTILFTGVLLFTVACNQPKDKKTQLEDLIKEQGKINTQISTLRQEIEKESGNAGKKFKQVAFQEMNPTLFIHSIDVQAKVDADQSVNAGAKMAGTVTDILVTEGQQIIKGQVLATLDDQVIRNGMAELQTQLDFATNVYNKQKNLWDQKIGSEIQYLTAKNNKEALEKKMASLHENWEMTKIKSPINGSVDNITIKVGQMLMPGVPAINVVSLEGIKVKGELAESYASKVKVGDEVLISFPDINKEIKSKVTYVSKVINTVTRTFTVEVRLTDETIGLKPNMVAVLRVIDYKNEKAFTTQVDYIQQSDEGQYVLVLTNQNGRNIAKKQPVQTGVTYAGIIEIISGIKQGEKIITAGHDDLVDGEEVKF